MDNTVIITETQEVSLTTLASEINAQHEQAETASRDALAHAKHAGELLIKAKARIAHGNFLPWVRSHFAGTPRTAQHYMKVVKHWDKITKDGAVSVRGALAVLKPKNESASHLADPLPYYRQVIKDLDEALN